MHKDDWIEKQKRDEQMMKIVELENEILKRDKRINLLECLMEVITTNVIETTRVNTNKDHRYGGFQ